MISCLKPPVELRQGYKSPKRLGLVASLGNCIVCSEFKLRRTTRLEIHHLTGCGLGKKASDLLSIYLCFFHHQKGGRGEAVHRGVAEFEKNFGTQKELLAITNERIFEMNDLKGDDLRDYESIKEWIKNRPD